MLPDRIADKIEVGDCWHWTAATEASGHGKVHWEGRAQKAHRVVWELLVGPIPEGLVIDHLCRNRACVNPDHLQVVTAEENTASMHGSSTHCVNGHANLPEFRLKRGRGNGECRLCHNNRNRSVA